MKKVIFSVFLFLGGAVVFVLGSPYYRIYPTNWNLSYYIALTLVFLVLSLVFKRIPSLEKFYPSAYAFFIASGALLFLKIGLLNIKGSPANLVEELALDKFSQFLHVVPIIILLTLLAKEDLKSIFITKGRLKQGLIFGLVSFATFALAAFWLQAGSIQEFSTISAAIPWLLLFIFANSLMEELWFRGIFLKKFEKLVGRSAAIIVTALAFGASHFSATYDFPGGDLVFAAVVTGMGLIGAYAMLKDDSVIGPVLFHAGYDLLIIVPVLSSM